MELSISLCFLVLFCLSAELWGAQPSATPFSPQSDNDYEQNYNEAMSFYNAGLLDKAKASFQKVIKIRPTAGAYHYLGMISQKKNQVKDAIWQWKQALNLEPRLAVVCFNIGLAYGSLKQVDEQIKWYKKAVALNPKYSKAWNNLGSVYLEKKRTTDALNAFRTSLKTNPHYAVAAENLALVYEKMGRHIEAKKEWKYAASIETRPEWKKVLAARAK